MKPTLSVIIPALNEGPNLEAAARGAFEGAKAHAGEFEILIFDDGSTDHTAQVASGLAQAHPQIRLIKNGVNKGLAYCYHEGLRQARMEYVMMIPGDNEIEPASVASLIARTGEKDLILGFQAAAHLRSPLRRYLSSLYTGLLNALFGLNARYFNGPTIVRRELLKDLDLECSSFLYMAELVIQLLQKQVSCMEAGFTFNPRSYGKSKALRLKSVLMAAHDLWRLWRRFGR